jgi:hypothetical protein
MTTAVTNALRGRLKQVRRRKGLDFRKTDIPAALE